ncbi:hypothetical protein [Nocardia wallacei]|uniref:hypothetical protein n=1 Tax=Nocardia wallacei TaxID=480035 RepID=UPI002457C057|nr:hypothetical protein [Nocardia wallacei]
MRTLGAWVDSGSVTHYQVIVYLAYVVAGVQSLLLGAPPNAVAQAMGPAIALLWTVLVIACPLTSLFGMWQDRRPSSLWFQLAGDSGVTFATAAYVAAVFSSTWFERATFAAWMAASITVCGALMTWRDIRRIQMVGRVVRERESDE